jgi:hypothetical protein
MTHLSQTAPELCSMSQCNGSLDFQPLNVWPESLPAVAINNWVLAGFSQDLVFNHHIENSSAETMARLFRSLHSELSFAEMARLMGKIKEQQTSDLSWVPLQLIAQKYHWTFNDQFIRIAEAFLKTPSGFQKWCGEKKVNPQDLAPLLAAQEIDLKFLFHDILNLNISKSSGVKALEMAIELILMGQKPEALSAEVLLTLLSQDQSAADAWVDALKQLRYPETFKRDRVLQAQMTALPWPGTSQARWARHGDRGGIELKLFVSQPSDLKKALLSLEKVQDLMETTSIRKTDKPETQH